MLPQLIGVSLLKPIVIGNILSFLDSRMFARFKSRFLSAIKSRSIPLSVIGSGYPGR
jgi:hypothetical protein